MKKEYYINFNNFSVEKFRESLRNRDMIPSRAVLKEELDKRFDILGQCGVVNLQELELALKTKELVNDFADKSGIPADYLTVLKREVSSFHPAPKNLSKFEGFNTGDINKLAVAGIKNTRQMFNKCESSEQMQVLADETGAKLNIIEELVGLSDLSRLYGVGPVFARMIYDAGIKSVKDFLDYTGADFVKLYESKTGKKADFSAKDIDLSLEIARELHN